MYSACVHALKDMHAAAVDRFSEEVRERVGGSTCVRMYACVCMCDIAFLSVGMVPVVV